MMAFGHGVGKGIRWRMLKVAFTLARMEYSVDR